MFDSPRLHEEVVMAPRWLVDDEPRTPKDVLVACSRSWNRIELGRTFGVTGHLSKCCRIVSRSGAFDLPRLRRGPCGEFRLATPSSSSCVRISLLVPLKIHKQVQKPTIVHAELGHSGERTRFSATSKDPKCPDNPLFWRHSAFPV